MQIHPDFPIDFSFELVTPEDAGHYVEVNQRRNRKAKTQWIRNLSQMVHESEWRPANGEAIKFGPLRDDGERDLLDGQNRLMAIRDSGVAVWCLIMRNVDPDDQVTMDSGIKRRLSDHLEMRGYTNAPRLASLANQLVRYYSGGGDAGVVRSYSHSPRAAIDWLEKNVDDVQEALRYGMRTAQRVDDRVYLSTNVAGFCYYVCSHLSANPDCAEDARFFFERLLDPEHAPEQGPYPIIDVLRWAIVTKERAKKGEEGTDRWYRAVIIKGWNHYIDGTERKSLGFIPSGTKKEHFPTPHWRAEGPDPEGD